MALTIKDIVSAELLDKIGVLKEIPAGESVEFRLCRAGRVDPSSSKKTSTPQADIYPGVTMIIDPFDKQTRVKTIQNIVGYDPIREVGKPVYMNPITEYIKFPSSGSIHCTQNDYNTYLFMMLDSRNRDNPFRKTDKAPKYYVVNEKKEIAVKNNTFTYKFLAAGLLQDLSEDDIASIALKVQRAYTTKYKIDLSADSEKLLSTLNSIADKDPLDIILSVKENNSYARVLADDAVNRRVIFFDEHPEKLQWNWKRTPGQKGRVTIVKLEPGNKPINGLVDFLTSASGSEHFAELKAQYEDYYSNSR